MCEFLSAEQNQLLDDKWDGKAYLCITVVGTKRAGSLECQFEESSSGDCLRRHSPLVAKPLMAISSVAVEATSPNAPAKKKKKERSATALAAAPFASIVFHAKKISGDHGSDNSTNYWYRN